MRALKVLLLGVVIPGSLSAALYGAARDGGGDGGVVTVRSIAVQAAREARAVAPAAPGEDLDSGPAACAHEREETLRLDPAGLRSVAVTSGSGDLHVTGSDEVSEIVVRARYCASSEGLLDDLDVVVEGRAGVAGIETEYPRGGGFGLLRYARIDLEVHLPPGMSGTIVDGSGDLRVAGLRDVEVDDGSGDLDVRGLDGSLRVADGSGDVELRDILGDVEVVDGSGSVGLTDIAGTVRVTDGSGDIVARGIGRDVIVGADGSGDIEVADVGGDFVVRADGSGEIEHSNVEGRVSIPERGRRR